MDIITRGSLLGPRLKLSSAEHKMNSSHIRLVFMIICIFSSKKQLFSKSNLHSPNLGPLLGLGFKVWRLGSRDKGLGFRG